MTEPTSGPRPLFVKLCPWLRPALQQLDAARAGARLGHAWLLAGPSGIGKLNLALVFTERLLGRQSAGAPPELGPAEAAAAMRDRHEPFDHHPDLHWVFPKKKDDDKDDPAEKGKAKAKQKRTIGIDQIRELKEALSLTSHGGRAKIAIVEPAEAMTVDSANALLKTLEEPSQDTYLLLVSHQPQRLPATIRSRCQRLDIPAPPPDRVREWLGPADPKQIAAVWHAGAGSPLAMAALLADEETNKTKDLVDKLSLVSQDKADLQMVASAWAKPDATEPVLTWLTRLLHLEIRSRLVPGVSTSITDPAAAVLHNAWAELTLRQLFGQYAKAEQLLTLLGGGINMELALHAFLMGFQADRGRS